MSASDVKGLRPKKLAVVLKAMIENRQSLMITGAPGIGKSDIVAQACESAGARLIISHPVVSDPTDYKGLPFASQDGKEAHFLPFSELNELIKAEVPTVYFLDDLGQAPPSVQAACMQLLLARRINGFSVSDKVTFIAATNRKEDKAGVSGILEPVKSRFVSIVELTPNLDDWIDWALDHGVPSTLIAFLRFKPSLLHDFKPTNDMTNSPCPRTVTSVGKILNMGFESDIRINLMKGAVGSGFATEFEAFLRVYGKLPSIQEILKHPDTTPVPVGNGSADILYALVGMLAEAASEENIDNIITYAKKMPAEYTLMSLRDAAKRNKSICKATAFKNWLMTNKTLFYQD